MTENTSDPPTTTLPPLTRRFSSIEREALGKAMQAVKQTADSYEKSGLSPFSFAIGMINIFTTGFILGKWPEYYWIYNIAKCGFYLFEMWKIRIKNKHEIMYMAEFCWIACHCYMIYLLYALLTFTGIVESNQFNQTENSWQKTFFLTYWCVANGPLGFSVIALKNALVLHDIPNLASVFIHGTPSSVTWTMLWYQDRIHAKFPGVFGIPDENWAEKVTFFDMFLPGSAFYWAWWIVYLVWMLFQGRFHGLCQSKYDTLYHYTMKDKGPAKMVGYNQKSPCDFLPVLKYMLIHAFFCHLFLIFSYVVWQNFWLHTLFCMSLFLTTIYFGAVRYYKMMTRFYIKSLENVVKDVNSKKKEQ